MYGILVKLRFVPSQFLQRIVNARQEMHAKDVLCYAFIVMSNTACFIQNDLSNVTLMSHSE